MIRRKEGGREREGKLVYGKADTFLGRRENLLVFGTGGEIFGQDRLRLGDDALGAGQRLEAREDPVPPEGELGVVWRGRVGIDEEEHVGCVFGGVGLLF